MASDSGQNLIDEITCRLIDYFSPVRVHLFGSEARGEAGPDSDLDFCVVLPDNAPETLDRTGIYRTLWDLGTAIDVVRFPLAEFNACASHVTSSLPAAVIREGKLLYDSATTTTQ